MSASRIREELRQVYGFQVPFAFARMLSGILDESWHPDGYRSSEIFQAEFERLLTLEGEISSTLADDFVLMNSFYGQRLGRRFGFLNMPPEFFPFGEDESAGRLYGFVVHDPDTFLAERPIAEFSVLADDLEFNKIRPISPLRRNLFLCGSAAIAAEDSKSGLKRILLRKAEEARIGESVAEVAATGRSLGYIGGTLEADTAARLIALLESEEEVLTESTHPVDAGWKHEDTLDGLGVFAASEMFWASRDLWDPPGFDCDADELAFIESFLKMKFPATALRLIRDLHWRRAGDFVLFESLVPLWRETYLEMKRPSLAMAVTDALNFRRKLLV